MRTKDFRSRPIELEKCWAFVRGDIDVSEFENWLYFESIAELALGTDAFLDAVSTDFGNPKRVNDLRHRLSEWLPAPAACHCHQFPNGQLTTMGSTSPDTFDDTDVRIDPLYWMRRVQCRVCGTQWWLVEECRIYDVWMLYRGWSNRPEVDTYRKLLALAVEKGAGVRYVNPYGSIEIPAAIEDLAKETPGIAVNELRRLIQVPVEVIRFHAGRVAQDVGVNIDLEN